MSQRAQCCVCVCVCDWKPPYYTFSLSLINNSNNNNNNTIPSQLKTASNTNQRQNARAKNPIIFILVKSVFECMRKFGYRFSSLSLSLVLSLIPILWFLFGTCTNYIYIYICLYACIYINEFDDMLLAYGMRPRKKANEKNWMNEWKEGEKKKQLENYVQLYRFRAQRNTTDEERRIDWTIWYERRLGKCRDDGYDAFGIDWKSTKQCLFVIHIWYKLAKWNKLVGWLDGFLFAVQLLAVGCWLLDGMRLNEYRTHSECTHTHTHQRLLAIFVHNTNIHRLINFVLIN